MNGNELFPLVDEEGNVTGSATRAYCHSGAKPLHPVVHLHIFNSAGELYLQKRSEHKDIQPGKWDTAVGGHVDFGEEVYQALFREAREELGVEGFKPVFCFRYVFESSVERELVNSFMTIYGGTPSPDLEEVTEGRFWNIAEIRDNIGKGIFTPNFEAEFGRLQPFIARTGERPEPEQKDGRHSG